MMNSLEGYIHEAELNLKRLQKWGKSVSYPLSLPLSSLPSHEHGFLSLSVP